MINTIANSYMYVKVTTLTLGSVRSDNGDLSLNVALVSNYQEI